VRSIAQKVGKVVALMADLQGPKIRVGKFAEGKIMLEPGEAFVLDASRTEPGDIHAVGLDYKELPRDVRPGDTLLLNDGLIKLTVTLCRARPCTPRWCWVASCPTTRASTRPVAA
jgi:pyruvate kinase